MSDNHNPTGAAILQLRAINKINEVEQLLLKLTARVTEAETQVKLLLDLYEPYTGKPEEQTEPVPAPEPEPVPEPEEEPAPEYTQADLWDLQRAMVLTDRLQTGRAFITRIYHDRVTPEIRDAFFARFDGNDLLRMGRAFNTHNRWPLWWVITVAAMSKDLKRPLPPKLPRRERGYNPEVQFTMLRQAFMV